MSYQRIYKDITVQNESSYGASIAGNQHRLHITSISLNQDPTKELIEDTANTTKGRDRIVRRRNVIEGDMAGIGTPRLLHHMFEWVNGVAPTVTAVGDSASLWEYYQNTSGNMLSKSLQIDRNNTQERFSGVAASGLELSASDDLLEATINLVAKTRATGISLADALGETIKAFNFADFTITINPGAAFDANSAITLKASEWNLKYENNLEASHLSGSRDIARVDPGVPVVNGMIKVFHEGATLANGAYGCSEYYLRIQATLPDCNGLVAGVTPYMLRIDVPRVELKTNVRNYEQAELSTEEIEWEGIFHGGMSVLWLPSITAGLSIS